MLSGLQHLRTHEYVGQPPLNVVEWTVMGAVTPVKNRVTRVEQTKRLGWSLGMASALMVALGYPGELLLHWFWWALVMVPFCFVVFQWVVGLMRPQASVRPRAVEAAVKINPVSQFVGLLQDLHTK